MHIHFSTGSTFSIRRNSNILPEPLFDTLGTDDILGLVRCLNYASRHAPYPYLTETTRPQNEHLC